MKTLLCALACVAVAGCSTFAVPRYSANAETVSALRALQPAKVRVGAFTGSNGSTSINCRGASPIEIPDGDTFEGYVRKGLVSELIISDIYDPKASVELSGSLEKADFNSNTGTWFLSLSLTSTTGAKLHVENDYKYSASFYGTVACNQTAQAALGATQDLIQKAVLDVRFKTLVSRQ